MVATVSTVPLAFATTRYYEEWVSAKKAHQPSIPLSHPNTPQGLLRPSLLPTQPIHHQHSHSAWSWRMDSRECPNNRDTTCKGLPRITAWLA